MIDFGFFLSSIPCTTRKICQAKLTAHLSASPYIKMRWRSTGESVFQRFFLTAFLIRLIYFVVLTVSISAIWLDGEPLRRQCWLNSPQIIRADYINRVTAFV